MSDPRTDKPTQTDSDRFWQGAADIQKRCACIRWEARDCIRARYPRSSDHLGGDWWEEVLDERCECRCHDEIAQLEEDIYGPDDLS